VCVCVCVPGTHDTVYDASHAETLMESRH